MSLINESEFKKLARFKNEICVSIFIPTERGGKEVLNEKNSKHLHSQWTETRKKLKEQGVSDEKIAEIGEPIEELIENRDFWRHQSDGLAIFSAPGVFENYTLPVNFEPYTYISEEFYVKPLVPAMNDDGKFYILALQLEDVKFYEATRYSITPVEIDDLTPSRLEERVGFDFKERSLQFRTQHEGGAKTQFHGHGDNQGDTKKEIKQYFRAIDDGLKDYMNQEKFPLIVACQDYLFSIYKDANTYNKLLDEVVKGNPNDTDMVGLHEKAVEVVEPYLSEKRQEKLEKYRELSKTENTTSAISDIIPAIYQGKVDTLFIENRAEVWGEYDHDNMKVSFSDNHNKSNTSLLNLAARKTIEMGGDVFLVEPEFMPEKESEVNALFRF